MLCCGVLCHVVLYCVFIYVVCCGVLFRVDVCRIVLCCVVSVCHDLLCCADMRYVMLTWCMLWGVLCLVVLYSLCCVLLCHDVM